MEVKHVEGKDKGKVTLFALSTCGWCRKTRELLEELDVGYDYTYVDQLRGAEQQEAIQGVLKFNPDCNFPTLVIDDDKCIIGYKEDEIRTALGK